jgi:hypothetical protein
LPELKTPEQPRDILQESEHVAAPPPVVAPTVAIAPAGASITVPSKREELQTPARDRADAQMQMPQTMRAIATTDQAAASEAAKAPNEFYFSNAAAAQNGPRGGLDGGFGNFGAANNSLANNSDVLNRFSMRQYGRRVDFRDADGSAYTGQVVTLKQGTNVFRAMGTNMTLQQSVIFTGQISRAAAPAQLKQRTAGRQVPLADQPLRVQGQATVGNTNQIQVDAQTMAPGK